MSNESYGLELGPYMLGCLCGRDVDLVIDAFLACVDEGEKDFYLSSPYTVLGTQCILSEYERDGLIVIPSYFALSEGKAKTVSFFLDFVTQGVDESLAEKTADEIVEEYCAYFKRAKEFLCKKQ